MGLRLVESSLFSSRYEIWSKRQKVVEYNLPSRFNAQRASSTHREESLFVHVVQNHGNHKENKDRSHSRNYGNGSNDIKDGSQIHSTSFHKFLIHCIDVSVFIANQDRLVSCFGVRMQIYHCHHHLLAESIDKSPDRRGIKE